MSSHEVYMQMALAEARQAWEEGEIPVGAVLLLPSGEVLKAHNTREHSSNPLHHAEMSLLPLAADHLKNWRLSDCTLYVTLEPCPMCLGALLQARLPCLVYGTHDPKREEPSEGVFQWPSLKNYRVLRGNNHEIQVIGGILQEESSQILKDFFKARRQS